MVMQADAQTEVAPAAAEAPPTAPEAERARRAAGVVAAALVLAGTVGAWPAVADVSAPGAGLLVAATGATLVLAVGIGSCRKVATLARLEAGLLATGLLVFLINAYRLIDRGRRPYPSDEGRLAQLATGALMHGHDPYVMRWPGAATFAGNTPLMGGGGVTRFGYPPLAIELGALLGHISAWLATPAVVATLGLAATAVVCFAALPAPWRMLAVVATLGLPQLVTYALNGHPVLVALPLLCAACVGWPRIGAGGRLGGRGAVQGVCLGLAAAAQQLAWFLAVALLLCVWLVRRSELGSRVGAAVTARLAGWAVAAFVVVDAPFVVARPRAWSDGVLSVFTQHAVPVGQGLVALNVVFRAQAGDLRWYSYAAALLFVAILAVLVVDLRRVAPVVPILVVLTFTMTARSPGEYFLVLVPVWIVWLAGPEHATWADYRSPAASRWLRTPGRRAGALALALLPAVACVAVAVTKPGPLSMRVAGTQAQGQRLREITVEVANRSDHAVTPHFYVDPRSHLKSAWRITSGLRTLAPGAHTTYVLRPGPLGPAQLSAGIRLWALSDSPPAMSSTALPATTGRP